MLELQIDGPVARLVINRPAQRNAMSRAMWEQVPALVAAAASDPDVRLLCVLSATQGMFCAGADIGEMAAHLGDEAWLAAQQAAIEAAQHSLVTAPMPTLAFVNGDCIGGGMALALACDIRIGGPAARLGITPALLGLVYPLHDTALLLGLIGPGQAARLLFSGSLIDRAEALRIGLIDEERGDWQEMAATIAGNASFSLTAIKTMLRRARAGLREDDAQSRALFAQAFKEPEFAERAARFLTRRARTA